MGIATNAAKTKYLKVVDNTINDLYVGGRNMSERRSFKYLGML